MVIIFSLISLFDYPELGLNERIHKLLELTQLTTILNLCSNLITIYVDIVNF